jgi:hypothetical protein
MSSGQEPNEQERRSPEGEPGGGGERRPPTEEELRAAYEEQIRQVRVEHVLLENVVTLANLGMRRTGLAPGTESERDPEQVRLAIESIRALMPALEQSAPQQAGQVREALSQLQLAFVKIGGQAAPASDETPPKAEPSESGGAPSGTGEPGSDQAGPAQRSGRLWVPGQ